VEHWHRPPVGWFELSTSFGMGTVRIIGSVACTLLGPEGPGPDPGDVVAEARVSRDRVAAPRGPRRRRLSPGGGGAPTVC